MTQLEPTAHSNAMIRPPCPRCGATMLLARIEPDTPGHDRRTFDARSARTRKPRWSISGERRRRAGAPLRASARLPARHQMIKPGPLPGLLGKLNPRFVVFRNAGTVLSLKRLRAPR
jgi:hypothetical protein